MRLLPCKIDGAKRKRDSDAKLSVIRGDENHYNLKATLLRKGFTNEDCATIIREYRD